MNKKPDPVTLEIIRNTLPAIATEMAANLQRASYNMMIYEVCDFCTALLDSRGRLLAQNVGGVSHFVADLGVIVEDGVAKYGADGFAEGDVIITNHQRVAGQHLNNIVIYVPIIYRGSLLGFTMTRAHWIDVGGQSTGFGATARVSDPWLEGLQLDQLKIYEAGKLNKALLAVIRDNIRFPDSSLGDLRAQIASCKMGARRFADVLQKYGHNTVLSAIEIIFEETELRCRRIVEQIPDGTYEAESFYDDDSVSDDPVHIHAKVIVSGSDMTIDLSKCSEQRKGGVNARTLAATRVAYKALTEPSAPVNEGSFSALKTIIPEGNVMMARYPAPMGAWSLIIPTVVDTIFRALAPAMPDRIPAAHHGLLGGSIIFVGKQPDTCQDFVVQSLEGGGWGGHSDKDGESASVSVCQGNVKNAPIESIELKTPVIIEKREFRTDSGGPGKFRGGLGVEVHVRNLVEGKWNLNRPRRQKCPPWGLHGGQPGGTAEYLLKLPDQSEYEAVDSVMRPVPANSHTIVRTGGGGGWGPAIERSIDKVVEDVSLGLVSRDSAERDYGVVLCDNPLRADIAATQRLRRRMAEEKGLCKGEAA